MNANINLNKKSNNRTLSQLKSTLNGFNGSFLCNINDDKIIEGDVILMFNPDVDCLQLYFPDMESHLNLTNNEDWVSDNQNNFDKLVSAFYFFTM